MLFMLILKIFLLIDLAVVILENDSNVHHAFSGALLAGFLAVDSTHKSPFPITPSGAPYFSLLQDPSSQIVRTLAQLAITKQLSHAKTNKT
jgi:hypothetical protein